MRSTSIIKIVSDAGPLLSFARAHRFDLLQAVVGELIIPEAVYDEIVIQGAGRPGAEEVRQSAWITRQHVQDRSFLERLPATLHLGEREALALARALNGVLLVDEHAVRQEAHRLGITYMGSLRVLTEAKARGLIPAIKPVLDELIATGTYLSDTLYQEFLSEVGEE
jgi:predicted nucleic acid-binding protein